MLEPLHKASLLPSPHVCDVIVYVTEVPLDSGGMRPSEDTCAAVRL